MSPVAPIPPAELAPSLRELGAATVLPARAYTAGDVFDWEQRHLFAASWTCLGRSDDVLPIGETHRALAIGHVPVLLARAGDGTLGAFANTCRHRGHELLEPGSTSAGRAVSCPYHAWSYDLAGALLAAPGFQDVPGFDASAHALVRLPVADWHGWLFVNATNDAGSFAEHVGALAGLVAPYAPERLHRRARHAYMVAANWKVVTENYHECYHCPLIHPELCAVSPPDSGDNYDLPGAWIGGTMDLRADADTMSLDGRSRAPAIERAERRRVHYLGLLPNLLLSLHPDYVMTHLMTPLAPDRTAIECSWFFAGPDVDPGYAVDFWDRTNRQDWAACESVQRGLASPHYLPGPLAPREDAVHQFVRTVARAYDGAPLAAAATGRDATPASPPA